MTQNHQVSTVAIYARESHGRDEDSSISVADQVDAVQAWADREGWSVVTIIRDVGSASRGSRRRRSRFGELLAVVESGTVDAVLAWEQSRFARSDAERATLEDTCEDAGVLLGYGGRLYDMTTTDDRLSSGITGVVSAAESRRTAERIRRRTAAAAREGRVHGKHLYGFTREYAADDRGHRTVTAVVAHPEQGPVVKRVFREALAGSGCYAIAKGLNADGVATRRPVRSSTRVQQWTAEAVREVLRNPAYAGKRVYKGEVVGDAVWDGLVTEEEFSQVQALLAGRSRPSRGFRPRHLCSGIAVCAVCGSVMTTGKQYAGRPRLADGSRNPSRQTYRTYQCTGSQNGGSGFHVSMKEEHLDMLVTEAVVARLSRPDFLALTSTDDDKVDTERQRLIDEISRMREYLDQVRAQAAETLDISVLLDQEMRLAPRIEALTRELEDLAGADPAVVALAGAEDVRAAWEGLDLDRQRHIVRALMVPVVSRAAVHGKKGVDPDRVEIRWR